MMARSDWQIAMPAAELAARRAWLGVPRSWMADYLEITDNDYARLERGKDFVTLNQADRVIALCDMTARAEAEVADQLSASQSPEIRIWRTDEAANADPGARGLPAAWWKSVAGRLQRRIPDLAVEWKD